MEVNDRGHGHDHLFGTGVQHETPGAEHAGIEAVADDSTHHAATEAHGFIDHVGLDLGQLAENLSHLPPDHVAGTEHGLEHDFGTHHDAGDGLHGLHDSIHSADTHLGFDEHHGLADVAHDPHHDDLADHHHNDGFGIHG
ncbi:MAG TPA: hypothetical protein VGJ03_09105 [Acidimicrobiales bacterium]